ncbi:hypothetical protein ACWED2_35525 [Amycolatopsis sp. NPDC005003]
MFRVKSWSIFSVVLLVLIGSATAAAAADFSRPKVQRCVTVLARLAPGEKVSRIVERHCDSVSSADSAHAPEAASSVLLLQYWKDDWFTGDSDTIRGSDGPCDEAGYGVPDVGSLHDSISSYRTFGTCSGLRGYVDEQYGGMSMLDKETALSGRNVPDFFDDRLDSFWVFKA